MLSKVAEKFLYVQSCILRYSQPVPVWQPLVERCKISSVVSGWQGEKGVIRVPTKNGYVLDKKELKWALTAYRLTFLKNTPVFQVRSICFDVQVLDERLKELDARKSSSLDSRRLLNFL